MKIFQNHKVDLLTLLANNEFDEYSKQYEEAQNKILQMRLLRDKLFDKYFAAFINFSQSKEQFKNNLKEDKKRREHMLNDPEFLEYLKYFEELKGTNNPALFNRIGSLLKDDLVGLHIYKYFFCFNVKTVDYLNVLEDVERQNKIELADFITLHPLNGLTIRNNIQEMIGKKLKNIRLNLGLSKEEFSKLYNIDIQKITYLEDKPYRIDKVDLEIYAKIANKNVHEFATECNLELIRREIHKDEYVEYYQIFGKQIEGSKLCL